MKRTRDLPPEARLLLGGSYVLLILLALGAAAWEWLTGTPAPWLGRP